MRPIRSVKRLWFASFGVLAMGTMLTIMPARGIQSGPARAQEPAIVGANSASGCTCVPVQGQCNAGLMQLEQKVIRNEADDVDELHWSFKANSSVRDQCTRIRVAVSGPVNGALATRTLANLSIYERDIVGEITISDYQRVSNPSIRISLSGTPSLCTVCVKPDESREGDAAATATVLSTPVARGLQESLRTKVQSAISREQVRAQEALLRMEQQGGQEEDRLTGMALSASSEAASQADEALNTVSVVRTFGADRGVD